MTEEYHRSMEYREDLIRGCAILREIATSLSTEYFAIQEQRDEAMKYADVYGEDSKGVLKNVFDNILDHLDADQSVMQHIVNKECQGVPHGIAFISNE